MRGPLRPRRPLPGLELQLSDRRSSGGVLLKSQVPPRVEDGASASGVHGSGVIEPRHGMREFSIDRTGGDYRDLEVPPNATGETCKAACEAETQCRAWTYARPGYLGPEA